MGNACLKMFDRNGDGKVTPDEVVRTLTDVVGIIGTITKQASIITQALKDAGVDTKNALDIMGSINKVIDIAAEFGDKFETIKIPKSLEEIGDVNHDGAIDKEDLVSYFTATKDICDTLIKHNVQVDAVKKYRDEIQKMIDGIQHAPSSGLHNSK